MKHGSIETNIKVYKRPYDQTTASNPIKRVKITQSNEQLLFKDIGIQKWLSFCFPLCSKVDKGKIRLTLRLSKNIHLPRNVTLLIISDLMVTNIEKEFIASHIIPLNIKKEFEALEALKNQANGKDIPQDIGIQYFKLQNGETPNEQLVNIYKKYNRPPSQILENPNIIKSFVTKTFIRLWDEIVQKDIEETESLEECEHNDLYEIPRNIARLIKLLDLSCSENQLTCLPIEIGHLKLLENIELNSNQLTCIPNEIGNLPLLEELNLRYNKIEALPKGIKGLSSLTDLNLSDNQLKTLPIEISKLAQLIHLHLENNQLTTLPRELCALENLICLDLEKNGLEALPEEIKNLTLEQLFLQHNPVTENIEPRTCDAFSPEQVEHLIDKIFDL